MKIKYVAMIISFVILFAGIMGCAVGTTGEIEPFNIGDPETSPVEDAEIYHPNNLKISITDAPTRYRDLQAVNVTFSRIDVSRGIDGQEEWERITIETDDNEPITVNLLNLTNGTLQTLGQANLSNGEYRQIRFYVDKASIVDKNFVEHDVHLASNKLKIFNSFIIEDGKMTSLVFDFDVSRSIKKLRHGRKERWHMTPIVRCVRRYQTGAITGKVVYPDDVKATVTAYRVGGTDSYASTITYYSGKFILGYLEPGIYDVEINAGEEDEYFLRVEDVEVEKGKIKNLGELTFLLRSNKSINTITVNVSIDIVNSAIMGSPVFIKVFAGDPEIPRDEFEAGTAQYLDGESAPFTRSIILDNSGEGYPDGSYGIFVLIDTIRDRKVTAAIDGQMKDYVAVGAVNINGGPASVEINGPWGSYFTLIVENPAPPADVTGKLYLALVSQGGYWGDNTFGENEFASPGRYIGMDSWAPNGFAYDFLAFIDTDNDNMDIAGGPGPGDYYTSLAVDFTVGEIVSPVWSLIDSWTQMQ